MSNFYQEIAVTVTPYTCPLIDDVIDFVKRTDEPRSEVCSTVNVLEQIRAANNALRSALNEEMKKSEDLEERLRNKEDENYYLTLDIEDLKKKLQELENSMPG